MIFYVFGVDVSTQNSIKINQKLKLKMDRLLASFFWWILVGFGSQVGVENRANSDQKSV